MKSLIFITSLLISFSLQAQQLIQNGDFETGPSQLGTSSLFVAYGVPHWKASHGGPNLHTVNGNKSADLIAASGIYTSCNFEAGKTYRVQFRRAHHSDLFIKAVNGLTPNNASLPTPFQSQTIKHIPVNAANYNWVTDYVYFTPTQNFSQLWIYNTVSNSTQQGALMDNISVLQCGGYSADFTQTACKLYKTTEIKCTNNDVFTTQNLWEVYASDNAIVAPSSTPIAVATGNDPTIPVSTTKRYLLVRHIVNNSGCTAVVKTALIDRTYLGRCRVGTIDPDPISE
ncbi:MAG: DUF642 domain-containing protein [Aureispira sp.]